MDSSTGAMASNVLTAAAINADAITAAKLASDVGTEIGTATWATTTRLLTAGTNIALSKGTGITGFNDIAATDVWSATTRTLSAGTNIVLAKGTGITGFNDLSAAQVNAEVDTALADYDPPTNTEMEARTLASASYATASALATVDTVVDTIQVTTDKLDDTLELDSTVYRFTANSLEQAPAAEGGLSASAIADEVQTRTIAAVTTVNGLANNAITAAATAPDFTTEVQSGLATSSALTTLSNTVGVAGAGLTAADDAVMTRLGSPAGASVSADVAAVKSDSAAILIDTAEIGTSGAGLTAVDDAVLAAIEQTARTDAAIVNCEVNTANFAGSTTTVACILTDRDGGAITAASGDLEGKELLILSGAQLYEGRFINDTTWDAANSELRLTLSRALPGTLADAVTAVVR